MSLFTETVLLRTRVVTGQDNLNNDVYGWQEDEAPAWLEARQGVEVTNARESSTSNMWLYLPLDWAVASVSEVVWDDITWKVAGDPARQPGGFIVEGYQQIALEKVTG